MVYCIALWKIATKSDFKIGIIRLILLRRSDKICDVYSMQQFAVKTYRVEGHNQGDVAADWLFLNNPLFKGGSSPLWGEVKLAVAANRVLEKILLVMRTSWVPLFYRRSNLCYRTATAFFSLPGFTKFDGIV